jgi:hypothetical protein
MLRTAARTLKRVAGSVGVYIAPQRADHVYIAEPHAWGMQRRVVIHDEPQFLELARTVKAAGRCMLGYDRLYVLWQCARNVATLDAAVGEVGSYRGGSAYFLASVFRALAGHDVPMHIFDTFQGHPEKIDPRHDTVHKAGMFADTSYEQVRTYLGGFPRLVMHKGEFSAQAASAPDQRYMLAHIDVDIYRTTLDALRYFGSRLLPGGVLVVDDFGAPKCPGVATAVEEYLSECPAYHVWHMRTEQVVLARMPRA